MADSLLYWEDFPEGERVTLGSVSVSAEEIIAFAKEYDPQPFHLDAEAAKASLLGDLSASGWHVCGLMMRVLCDGYLLKSAAMGAPGVEEMRWKRPVHAGDTLTVHRTTLARRTSKSRPEMGLTHFAIEIVNQRGETTTLARFWQLFARRHPGV